jgi:hypothetical protein
MPLVFLLINFPLQRLRQLLVPVSRMEVVLLRLMLKFEMATSSVALDGLLSATARYSQRPAFRGMLLRLVSY